MSFLDDLRIKRKKFLDGLEANQGDIDLDIFEDFYPDKAHFIYELLQNAEDANASNVRFVLSEKSLVCEHDGRSFDEADIKAITGIGAGTKREDDDKIGRFGIGFKATFVYTDSPRIWSPKFAFEISDMVLPTEMALKPSLGDRTRFEFPFDSSKKPAGDAFCEVKAGLEEISADTLLFLSHIESIDWRVEGETGANLLRVSHSDHHVETLKERDGKATKSSHFLRFTQLVEGLDKQYVAIAFELDPSPSGSSSSTNVPLAKRFGITPTKPGRVAVYFACAKEASGLRFHLHAPFVPELSRASVKDTPANEPLFQQLAGLAADSLSTIRDLGLLDRDFLAALPNPSDNLPARYECIRAAVVDAMNEQPLTPTHSGGHAPAECLLQARAPLKNLLSTEDIAILRGSEGARNDWAVGAQRNNDVDRFLRSLDIEEWNVDRLVGLLKRLGRQVYMKYDGPDEKRLLEWLRSKPDEWHQALYALFYREYENRMSQVRDLYIVRLSTGEYRPGSECYFPTDEVQEDPILPRVARDTYTSGESKAEQDGARKFLEAAGVREVGEREHVEAILEQRYSDEAEGPDKETHGKDLQRFIGFAEARPKAANIFEDYHIFKCEDDSWRKPSEIYLDTPYSETGLRAFFEALHDDEDNARPVALADHYLKFRIQKEKLVAFAKATGAQTKLIPKKQRIWDHPDRNRLRQGGGYVTSTEIDCDWTIPNLSSALKHPSEDISRLIWNTMRKASEEVLEAKYRRNQRHSLKTAPSTLILTLKKLPWIPQRNGEFVRPAEASRDLLPEGFAFAHGWAWLKAIRFEEESAKRDEDHRRTREKYRELGFKTDADIEDAQWFATLDPAARREIRAKQEQPIANLPDQQPRNPERRKEWVRRKAVNAPGRGTSIRNRSVSVHREEVKEETDPYLREQYTNSDGVMICQVCKKALPFRLENGHYYFEAVEFLSILKRRHYQNYLALCPNHAAMYVHANDSRETMMELFLDLHGNELEVVLANEDETIYFTRTHIADLAAIIEAESSDQ